MFFLKKTLSAFPLLLVLLSCSEEFSYRRPSPALLEVDSDEIDFTGAAGSYALSVESSSAWKASVDAGADWVELETVDEKTLLVSVPGNPDIFPREASVKLSSAGGAVVVKVCQSALDFSFSALAGTTELGYEAGTVAISVDTDLSSWEAVSSADWISLPTSPASSFSASVSSNYNLAGRSGDIDFYRSGVLIGRITLTQAPVVPSVTFPQDVYVFESSSFSETLTLTANYEWSASIDATGATWLEIITPEAGEDGLIPAGTASVTIRGGEAIPAREAVITFVSGDSTFPLTIRQNGVPTSLEVDKTALSLPWKASSDVFTVTTNNAWEIIELPEWAEATPSSGSSGSTQVTISCGALNALSRDGDVKIKAGDKTCSVSLHQAGGPFQKTIIFADGTNVFREVLTPELKSSTSKANNLGIVTEKITADPDYVMEYYSRGRTLASLASSGIRIQVEPASGQSTSRQLREENFAFVKFPGYEGYKLTSISIYFVTAGYVFVTSTYGNSNDEARAAAQTDVSYAAETGKVNDFVLSSPAVNTPYYLFFPETNSGEIRMWSFTVNYTPAE